MISLQMTKIKQERLSLVKVVRYMMKLAAASYLITDTSLVHSPDTQKHALFPDSLPACLPVGNVSIQHYISVRLNTSDTMKTSKNVLS